MSLFYENGSRVFALDNTFPDIVINQASNDGLYGIFISNLREINDGNQDVIITTDILEYMEIAVLTDDLSWGRHREEINRKVISLPQ